MVRFYEVFVTYAGRDRESFGRFLLESYARKTVSALENGGSKAEMVVVEVKL